MHGKSFPLAKLSRPLSPGVLGRERLFALLDEASERTVTWVAGPAGSGKTTLVSTYLENRSLPHLWYQLDEGDGDIASFFYYLGKAASQVTADSPAPMPLLTPEYLQDIATFSRRFFEKLCSLLAPSSVLVFDNYHEVPDDSRFHEFFRVGLAAVPKGITVILISRSDPPPSLIRLRASQKLTLIGWEDIRLTPDESYRILRGEEYFFLSEGAAQAIYEKAQGWAAGLILLGERLKSQDAGQLPPTSLPQEEIFHYFAGEIFSHIEENSQDFLLKAAFLPQMTPKIARSLSGYADADDLLAALQRNYFFTERHSGEDPLYIFHPLFREFLLDRARKTFPAEVLAAITRQAASLFEKEGLIDEAARLFLQGDDAESVARLVLGQGPVMLSQGRNETMERWIRALPEEHLARQPFLRYWLGMCRQPYNPVEARQYFIEAYQAATEDQAVLRILSWAAIVDGYRYEWNNFSPLDGWIERLPEIGSGQLPPMPPEVETRVASSIVGALMVRRPDHPRLDYWLERLLDLARDIMDPELRVHAYSILVNYYFWVGDTGKGRVVLEEIRLLAHSSQASPLTKITWNWLESAIETWMKTDYEKARRMIQAALDYAAESGVHLWSHMLLSMGAYCCLMQNDLTSAENEFLEPMAKRLDNNRQHMFCQHHYLLAWKDYLRQDHSQALAHAEIALRHARETGYVFPEILSLLAMVWILHDLGRGEETEEYLNLAQDLSERSRNMVTSYTCLLVRAQLGFEAGREDAAWAALGKALQMGREQGYYSPIWWCEPPFLAGLCARALAQGLETEYVRDLIRRRHLVLDSPPLHLLNWPWAVRIRTLGPFSLSCNGEAVNSSRKAQKKPLEMLKALIAYGGKDVSEERISEALWPDADGDMAHKSFATTLHRLRQLLGEKKALSLQAGRLSIDQCYCWVDALIFADRFEAAKEEIEGADSEVAACRSVEELLDLYGGEFLEGESDNDWALPCREKLHRKCLSLITLLGGRFEEAGRADKAVACYERGLEFDPLAENLYQRLMICHQQAGLVSEAVKVFHRCRDRFSSLLNIEPPTELLKTYQEICPD